MRVIKHLGYIIDIICIILFIMIDIININKTLYTFIFILFIFTLSMNHIIQYIIYKNNINGE